MRRRVLSRTRGSTRFASPTNEDRIPFQVEREGRGAHLVFSGAVTDADILEVNRKVYGHANFNKSRCVIYDFVLASAIKISLNEVREISPFNATALVPKPRLSIAA